MVLVSSADHGDLEADPRIHPLANLVDLDRPVKELEAEQRAWLEAAAKLRGVSAAGSARDVVRRLGGSSIRSSTRVRSGRGRGLLEVARYPLIGERVRLAFPLLQGLRLT